MRIVGGKYRGKKLFSPPATAPIRPTTDRHRETVFNLLTQGKYGNLIKGQNILDVFTGTGAMAIEALSRGAASAHLIDKDITTAKKNVKHLALESVTSFTAAMIDKLPEAPQKFAVIFCDPPYKEDLIPLTLQNLIEKNWIAETAFIFIETHRKDKLETPEEMTLLDTRTYGKTKLSILKMQA
ncbi:MAG: 16S rRNA (guanine(966)-N(2))-methyltransferase RsmD [Alphaproteobacteria bacterium]